MINPKLLAVTMFAISVALMPVGASAQVDEAVAGQVTKIDPGAGKITIKHGPLKQFGMDDGMTMVFKAGDPSMLKSVKAGDKVTFVPERVNGQFTIKKIEKTK